MNMMVITNIKYAIVDDRDFCVIRKYPKSVPLLDSSEGNVGDLEITEEVIYGRRIRNPINGSTVIVGIESGAARVLLLEYQMVQSYIDTAESLRDDLRMCRESYTEKAKRLESITGMGFWKRLHSAFFGFKVPQ